MYDVCVVGLGFVGLPISIVMSEKGLSVAGSDISSDRVAGVNKGQVTLGEEDLELLLDRVVNGTVPPKLRAFEEPQPAGTYVVAVPTPVTSQRKADLTYVFSAIRQIAKVVEIGGLIVIESTSPKGTTKACYDLLVELRPELKDQVHFAFCPERLLPGNIHHELTTNARIVGGLTVEATEKAAHFYSSFLSVPITHTSAEYAELCKVVENCYRDTVLAFANEIDMMFARAGLDSSHLIHLVNQHPRVDVLTPSVGVGGHCIPVDPWFVITKDTPFLRAARDTNLSKTDFVIETIMREINTKKPRCVFLGGATYKPDTPDFRESPALHVVKALRKYCDGQGVTLIAHDPYSSGSHLLVGGKPEIIMKGAMTVLLVPHKEYLGLEFDLRF